MNYDQTPDWESMPTMTVAEFAKIMGIGKRQAYLAVANGDIKTIRIGRRILISTRYVRSILDEGELP